MECDHGVAVRGRIDVSFATMKILDKSACTIASSTDATIC